MSFLGHFQEFKSITTHEKKKKKNSSSPMPKLIDEEGKSLKLLTWGTNLFMKGGSKDPGRKRECQAVMGLCGHNIHQNPPGKGDRAMPWQGELGKAALHSQNNPPYTSNATLQIHLLNKTPKPLSSFPSQLSWERQACGSNICHSCSDCAAMGNLPEIWDRQGSLTPKNDRASY